MPKKSGTRFMMEFVQEYLKGGMGRVDFDLDFNHYLMEHYAKMERECPDLADCLHYYLTEQGIDNSSHLNDSDHKKLIRIQWSKVESAMQDGIL